MRLIAFVLPRIIAEPKWRSRRLAVRSGIKHDTPKMLEAGRRGVEVAFCSFDTKRGTEELVGPSF